jgi:hypothetical protein
MKKIMIIAVLMIMAATAFAAEVEKFEDGIIYVTDTTDKWCYFVVVEDDTVAWGYVEDGMVPLLDIETCTVYIESPMVDGAVNNIIVEVVDGEIHDN